MATAEERKEFDRKAGGKMTHPIPKPPEFPKEIFDKPVPERKAAVERFNKELDDWRKKIAIPELEAVVAAATGATTPAGTSTAGPKGSKGDKGDKGDPGPITPLEDHFHRIADVLALQETLDDKALATDLATEVTNRTNADTALAALIAAVDRVIHLSTTQVNNSGVADTDLWSQALDAGIMGADGDALHFVYGLTVAASVNNQLIRVRFGATVIFSWTNLAPANAFTAVIEGWIWRTGAATQKAFVKLTTADGVAHLHSGFGSPVETLSGAVTLKVTAQGGASNEVTFESGMIEFKGAP